MIGAGSLKPEHDPTATIVFNMATAGGSALGVGLLPTFVQARTEIHGAAWPAIH